MSKRFYSELINSLPRWANPLLSWVVAGSFLGTLEGIWRVREWSFPGPGNLQSWMEFSAARFLFVLSALSLYGMLFVLVGAISLILCRTLLPSISPADRYSIHFPLGLSLLFFVEDILVIIPKMIIQLELQKLLIVNTI